jgi:aminoglycoside phosphotransferase
MKSTATHNTVRRRPQSSPGRPAGFIWKAAPVDIASWSARLLGADRVHVRPTGSPVAFFVDSPERTVVAKLPSVGRPGSALVEAWAYDAAAASGARTPAVVAVQDDPELVLLECLPGVSLWSRDRPKGVDAAMWRRAGEDLRALHEIRLPGFGPAIPDGDAIRGEADAWCPFARYTRDEGIRYVVDAGLLTPHEGGRLEERLDEAAPRLHATTDGRLLHGDLEGGHIFVTTDRHYQGLIDFSQAQIGDPLWDIARVRLWDGDAALDALLDGYGHDTMTADDRAVLLPLYLLTFVVPHVVALCAAGTIDHVAEMLEKSGYSALV